MLEAIGYDASLARWDAVADARVGRVVHASRGLATLLTEEGPVRATYGGRVLAAIAADSAAAPCPGDWGVVRDWRDRRVTLERLLPRRTALVRAIGVRAHHEPVLAANVDLVAVVAAADGDPEPTRLAALRDIARRSGVEHVLVLTRCDLVAQPQTVAEAWGIEDCRVMCTSAVTGRGLDELRRLVDGQLTLALLGSPGQGMGTLVRALVGELAARRAGSRRLHLLPTGGAVIDTPGLRAVA